MLLFRIIIISTLFLTPLVAKARCEESSVATDKAEAADKTEIVDNTEAAERIEATDDTLKPEMLLLEASVLYEKGRSEEAISLLEKALVLKPEYYDAAYRLGIIYVNMQQYEKAIEYFKKVIEIKPDFTSAYLNLGAACGHLKLYNEALKYLDVALSQDKQNPKIYYNIALVFLSAGDTKKGTYFLSRAKELSVKNNDKAMLERIDKLYKK